MGRRPSQTTPMPQPPRFYKRCPRCEEVTENNYEETCDWCSELFGYPVHLIPQFTVQQLKHREPGVPVQSPKSKWKWRGLFWMFNEYDI